MQKLLLTATLIGTGLTLAACGETSYPAALGITLEDVDRIRDPNDTTLADDERRELLAQYDIDEVTINGLLEGIRLANQFGGNLESAFNKVVNEQLGQMTPDEIQYFGDATDQTTYDDAEAQAIADFFDDYGIDSLEDVQEFLDDPTTALPPEIDEPNLRGVFVDTSIDRVRNKLP